MTRGFFIDVQGTLIDDINKEPINGACEFIDFLNNENIPYVVITNNTKEKSDVFLEDLKIKGLKIKNYIDPFSILTENLKSKKIAAFGTNKFLEVLKSFGYEIDYEKFDTLVVSIKKDYSNEDYANMIECAIKAKELIGMHETSTYSKNGKRYPGVGAIMHMIKFAVNKEYKVVGKPSLSFYDKARELTSLDFKDITVISDDMIGDLLGALKLDMSACLVLSGKVRAKEEVLNTLSVEEIPKNICKDMSEVLELLKKGEI
ncbi:HAD-IIA family hydrolase [Arcobacter sp. LA11]|uniref:HAD-IIA family hydrolase n=1 Tax=Arcobacter sp. LA11 TaxID=1898176 RepID=UPI000934AB73|nr:HAD-IIA family hydrolase [Arcobacter sp. LA11]